jgi:hypothetical protein
VEFFDPTVATLRRGGSATLLGAGTAAIAASMGGQKASSVLTVTVAVSPVFTAQPVNTNVSAVIDAGGVKVQWLDNVVGPLPGQRITVAIGTNPPGTGALTGTLRQTTDSAGTATFPDLKIDWLGARSMVHPEDGKAAAKGRAA